VKDLSEQHETRQSSFFNQKILLEEDPKEADAARK